MEPEEATTNIQKCEELEMLKAAARKLASEAKVTVDGHLENLQPKIAEAEEKWTEVHRELEELRNKLNAALVEPFQLRLQEIRDRIDQLENIRRVPDLKTQIESME